MRDEGLELHPLNLGFEWSNHRGPYRCVSPEQAGQYDRDGFFLLEGAVARDTCERLIAAIDPFEQVLEDKLRSLDRGRAFIARAGEITFTTHLVTRSEVCREFVCSQLFRDLCFDLLGTDVRLYWDQAVYKKPGTASPFPWHQDNGYAYVEPQQYLSCWVALTDTDESSACPVVAPGLHHNGTLAHRASELGFVCLDDPSGTVAVPARAGDVVVFSSLTPHCTGPNRTRDHVRKSYIVQFAPDGAVVRAVSAEGRVTDTAADAPERQFRILADGGKPTPGDR